MLEVFVRKVDEISERCDIFIMRLQAKLNFNTNSTVVHNLKMLLAKEKGEHFPLVVRP